MQCIQRKMTETHHKIMKTLIEIKIENWQI